MPSKFITPRFPAGQFLLTALDGEITLGPFEASDFQAQDDGSVVNYGMDKPVTLRVRSQHGRMLQANDGDEGDMTYTIESYLPGE